MGLMLLIIVSVVFCCLVDCGQAWADWTVVVPQKLAKEEAIKVAVEDLISAGSAHGTRIKIMAESEQSKDDVIFVGGPTDNAVVRRMCDAGTLNLAGVTNVEGYEIATLPTPGHKTIVVAGGSVLGNVYGLYWIWDRLRVYGQIPDINTKREPSLQIRFTRIVVQNKEDIRRALRYGLNLVFGENPLRLVPWNAEPENVENERYRAETRELAAYAHALGLKFVTFGTEFTYHPSLLKEFDATLNPADPKFWEAVQAKYRRLLKAMPELDGVCTFTADEQAFWGNYKTFDMMHGGEGCDWELAKRYRTYIIKMWEVVVGEFDKILMNHTWATNMFEQQSQAEVYRAIFTDAVPTGNLYLFPSFTQNDRWWFQAYNPTINQTPHNTMVVCEMMDYQEGGDTFPTFPGLYFQSGLKTMLDVENTNLKGISLDMPSTDNWLARSLTAYSVSRLSWDHHSDVRGIADDFAGIHFGQAAAKGMGELLLMSPVAYAYGLYIEPVAYGEFCSLPHIRVGQFVGIGCPRIDGGKEHIEFLRKIYLRCRPWIPETLMYLDHGLETANTMLEKYEAVQGSIKDPSLEKGVTQSLQLMQRLIQTNNCYVRAVFAYFNYSENINDENRQQLVTAHASLLEARDRFAATPGFEFQLFGVDQLLLNIDQTLSDPVRAAQILANAPTKEGIAKLVAEEQANYERILERYKAEAVQILHWRGRIDGEDIVRVCGPDVTVEHLRWDAAFVEKCEVLANLPKSVVTIIPRSIQSRPLHPFVLEQPSPKNGFTAEIYLNDLPGGGDWWEFELYYIPRSPVELGLRPSLKAGF